MYSKFRSTGSFGPLAAAGLLLLPCLIIGPALGQETASTRIVENPAQAAAGVVKIDPVEMWRIGGEDDDVFFGTVGSIRADANGDLYVLDSQLSETHVYSSSGEFLRTIGGEGDGPGEVRNPGDMFLSEDGNICILQGFPGKIVELKPDGTPAGETVYSVGEGAAGQFTVLIRGLADGSGMLLGGIRMGATGQQTYFLDRCDRQGKRIVSLTEKVVTINFADLEMNEGASDFIWQRIAAGSDGRVFAAIPRNEYAISVFTSNGDLEKIIKRPYVSKNRDKQEKQIAHRIQEGIGSNYPAPPKRIIIEDTQPDISQLTVMADGRLWVQTSVGDQNAPDGCWVVLDVFTADGRFEKQVALSGNHSATKDGLILLADGRAMVIVGALDAWLNQMGAVQEEADDAAESSPLEIICYQLEID
ncbi:MAG: 6-bladed beta-propeller [Gemmatimonadales bacterium]|nr:6-bladed beta-propeller [Gemmatimonadales bacterium]